ANALNQVFEREIDARMSRTSARRPLPQGKISWKGALIFSSAIGIIGVLLFYWFFNLLTALLALGTILFYSFFYTLWLKPNTPQNIVIGGIAGAMAPVGAWTAATGQMDVAPWIMFLIIFLWTPPHFWALALVRQKDYARAGVPMLPVVRGEQETRWQIFIYTIELVVLTLILPLFGLGGSVYLIGASLLGVWLLFAAWKVWKQGGNKVAWKMYRYSSMYLLFLFAVLMVDALL
ncbi:MAG: heme o synthase, partial [Anaerolineales bacterium]|nr:heme o synthase [Anaerolineales bacterium]